MHWLPTRTRSNKLLRSPLAAWVLDVKDLGNLCMRAYHSRTSTNHTFDRNSTQTHRDVKQWKLLSTRFSYRTRGACFKEFVSSLASSALMDCLSWSTKWIDTWRFDLGNHPSATIKAMKFSIKKPEFSFWWLTFTANSLTKKSRMVWELFSHFLLFLDLTPQASWLHDYDFGNAPFSLSSNCVRGQGLLQFLKPVINVRIATLSQRAAEGGSLQGEKSLWNCFTRTRRPTVDTFEQPVLFVFHLADFWFSRWLQALSVILQALS